MLLFSGDGVCGPIPICMFPSSILFWPSHLHPLQRSHLGFLLHPMAALPGEQQHVCLLFLWSLLLNMAILFFVIHFFPLFSRVRFSSSSFLSSTQPHNRINANSLSFSLNQFLFCPPAPSAAYFLRVSCDVIGQNSFYLIDLVTEPRQANLGFYISVCLYFLQLCK